MSNFFKNIYMPYLTLILVCWNQTQSLSVWSGVKRKHCAKCDKWFIGINWVLRSFNERIYGTFLCIFIANLVMCKFAKCAGKELRKAVWDNRYDNKCFTQLKSIKIPHKLLLFYDVDKIIYSFITFLKK